ncbi:MAG TPA: hypothetical protein VJP76_05085, partial [Candidatus Tumulicola sp.]|nr:hypothetical protein [Candidatus Tumulicola sp.]
GLLVPAQRRRLLEARTIAARIESPPLQTSIELLVDSPELRDCGVFKNLVDRIVRAPIKTRHERLFVDVQRGHVRRGSEMLRVSDRGLELLAALSLFEPGTPNDALAAALWPGLERRAAVNALKVCVSRTRAQLHDRESICNARSGYALGDHVRSDVRELERLSHLVRGGVTLGESLRLQLAERCGAAERLPAHAAGWEWFAPYGAYLNELRRELAHALAQDAARRELKAERQPIPT